MALQGDLDSFALPDVLRLLAGTGKTGRLGVTCADSSGEVWLRDGEIVGGSVTSSPHATKPADLVFELLRVDGGSFAFDDGEQLVDGGERSTVTDAIAAAEALVAEWAEVEAVVPSVHAPIALAPELTGGEVTVSAEQWRLLASLRSGTTVRALADQHRVTDLEASRRVKGLVEAGLVRLDDVPTAVEPPDTFGLGGFVETQDGSGEPEGRPATDPVRDDLALLSAEDGPVVLESSDGALLPEPLPGSGTTFAGDMEAMGTVDGRSFEAVGAEAPADAAAIDSSPEPQPDDDTKHDDTEDDPDASGDGRSSLLRFLSSVKS